MDNKNKKACPNCSQLYFIKSISPVLKGNIPLFLSCGHSMCENCVRNIVKFMEPIECKVCHQDMEIMASDVALLAINTQHLYQSFPVNIYMLGELTMQAIESHELNSKKTDEDHYINLQALLKSVDDTQGKCLECHNPTKKMCQQCATILCDACFTKSHKNFIIFKNHVLQNIETLTEQNTCKVHCDKLLDYYCKDCSKSICMDCMMVGGDKSCKNHNVVSMAEVNESFLEEIYNVSPQVDETFRRLTKTAVDVGNLLHNIENESGSSSESTQVIANIEQHFSKLFSALQEHKKSVIAIVNKLKCSERDSLMLAKNNLKEAIKKARQVMKTIHFITDQKKIKQLNLSILLEDAKNVLETPWYLSQDQAKQDPLKVIVNEELCNLISDFIHLEGNANGAYKLRATFELEEGLEIPPPPPAPVFPPELPKDVRQLNKPKPKEDSQKTLQFYKNAPKYRSKSGSVSSINSIGSDHSNSTYGDTYQRPVVQPVQPFVESQQPKQLHEGSQELIYISHIVDPHNFYVQRACHQSLVKDMLREFRNAISLPKPSISHVAEGKVYLAFNKPDNMWQRCRIVSIDRKNPTNPVFHVFCIDFGSTETVTIDKLRLLSPARLQSPYPLAINCCLANCEPKTGTWTSDDSFLIQNIIDNKQAVIHVRSIRSTNNFSVTLECDVITFEGGVSIAHALVFHERAKMPNPKLQYPKNMGGREIPKIFMSNNDFKPKTPEEVYISHIVSPDKFFVRKRHLQGVYEKLCEDMEQEYSLTDNTGAVYLPEIGAVYAVNVDKCGGAGAGAGAGAGGDGGGWVRGVATETPGRARVRVWLPDGGGAALLHCSALRHLHPRFATLRALATECHLAGVTPLNKKWSTGSVALLHKFEDRLLELHVEDSRSHGSLGVTLYDKQHEDNIICINYEMIKYKFAVSFGMFKFNKGEDMEDQSFTDNKTPLEEPTKPKPKPEKIMILKRQTPKIKEKDLEAKDKGPLRLEAKLLQYQSPSLLYVALVHQQKAFNELYENMQKYYAKNKINQGKVEWNVGDRCCTLCTESQTWRRAVIVEKEKDHAKVFYSDFACIETAVPLTNLRELTSDFASIGDAAIKCHLSGVMPAVGEEWPSLTKEFLKELLDAYKRVFITKSGNFKNKSMPVEVWVYHTIQGGALEPNTSEWRCLNNKIIDQGLGIPDKQEASGPDAGADGDDNVLSFLNITGSVHEWLQLEHLPTKPLPNKSGSESNSNSSTPVECYEDDNSTQEADDSTIYISDWMPPEPLQCKEFTAMPTYIDNDGFIYLHDITQQDTLDLIRKALDVRFKDPDPKAKHAKWRVGEPCIAMFFLDNRFYRGRVLDVNKETSMCLIHYIDYGNEELCSFANLRKSIALYQIPIQAHRCVLDRIRPKDNQWDRQVLDYIHKSIVEKQCYVKITGEKMNGILPIELKYNKLWINEHLVDFEMAEYIDGSKAVVRKFAQTKSKKVTEEIVLTETDSGPDYIIEEQDSADLLSTSQKSSELTKKDWNKLMEEDDNLDGDFIEFSKNNADEFLCNITVINDIKTLQLDLIHNDETNILYEEMFEKLQKVSEHMKPLNGIYENKACVALFPEDGRWYRATVLQFSEADNKIKVRYADYGNIEIISLSDVREITVEWTSLPPASISVNIHGVQLKPDVDVNLVIQEYSKTFLDKGPFHAKVVTHVGSTPCVELRNDEGELAYTSLIEKEIFIPTVD